MSLRRPSLWLLAMAIALPAMAGPGDMGRPGGWESPAPQYGHGAGPGFGHRVDRLPGGVETLLLAGLTYYVLDGIFYRRQENHYVVVSPPPQVLVVAETGLIPLDLDGRRYYVREGHYYLREIDGRYTEVPPPAALR
ncbi:MULTISPECIES: DUF6515 family protein [Aeromonas]|uniref:DUF6515 family protein n=1 Tax=Aeromonas TaxID=642 RepID=UPI0029D7F09A|nr:DUF6515 family protein [Aeromonas caviae]MDX7842174.1 DUF6515 family protein [Aeromonas caviae]